MLLLALALPCVLGKAAVAEQQKFEADVVIVGAGMAGVTAARNLSDAGHKVIVLEGRDRSGGRLHSTPVTAGGERARNIHLHALH